MRKTNSFEKLNKISKDNKGSVMITVLVAFLFVAVLASIILATVTVNFKMRSIDRRTKDEFYYAEKALNDLYNGIGQECSEIMGETYNDVLSKYKKSDDVYFFSNLKDKNGNSGELFHSKSKDRIYYVTVEIKEHGKPEVLGTYTSTMQTGTEAE